MTLDSRRDHWLVVGALLVILIFALAVVSSAPAAAQTNNTTINQTAPYYNNASADVDSNAWFDGLENATMDDIVTMALRVGPYVIGTGEPVGGGAGYEGVLLLGLVVAGVFLGSIAGTPIGTGGAGIVALMTGYGLIEVGLAPEWIRIVLLFLLGTVIAVVVIRTAR